MKRVMAVCLTAITLVAMGCITPPLQVRDDFSLTAGWEGFERVEVNTRNGRVELRSAAVKDVEISGFKCLNVWSLADGERMLPELEVYAGAHAARPDTLLIELRVPETLRHNNPSASFVVAVPQPCAVNIDTSNGSIEVAGLKGDVDLDTNNGHIEVTDVDGRVRADTSNGRVVVEDVRGDVLADTSNGRILARRITGRCELYTSNGSVRVEQADGELEVRTSNGGVDVDADPSAGARVNVTTSNGSIRMRVPESFGADIDLRTSNGRITTALGSATFRHIKAGRDRFAAEMNGGGGVLRASTSNGRIELETR